jgi:hypothetical protein
MSFREDNRAASSVMLSETKHLAQLPELLLDRRVSSYSGRDPYLASSTQADYNQ